MENLAELVKHPGWQEYLDAVEAEMVALFMGVFQLNASKPESFIKFVELKSKIDQLRDITYGISLQIADSPEKVDAVNASFSKRFVGMLKKILRSHE